MKMYLQKETNRWVIATALSLVLILIVQKATFAQEVNVTLIDAEATGYGTFQSHSQKVVHNKNGIFMTHMRTYKPGNWRLSRSTDGGKTFSTMYEGPRTKKPPVIEMDENNNLYVMHFILERTKTTPYRMYFYRFMAKADGSYRKPIITSIDAGKAFGESTYKGKKTMLYDQARKQFYVWGPGLFTIQLDGTIKFSKMMMVLGEINQFEYPHLTLDSKGVLYASVTTENRNQSRYLYRDIGVMKSPDGGKTWTNLSGTVTHKLPLKADAPALERITTKKEFEVHTWLSSAMAKGGKLHFAYQAHFSPRRFRYKRYDPNTGMKEIEILDFKGENIRINGVDGFFASKDNTAESPLYYIGHTGPTAKAGFQGGGTKIGVLVSYDNGDTWNDYAESKEVYYRLFGVGGTRKIGKDGLITGSFTKVRGSDYKVYAFTIRTEVTSSDGETSPNPLPTPDTAPPNAPIGLHVRVVE